MKLLVFFVRYSPRLILLAIAVGALAGASTAALIAFTNAALTRASPPSARAAVRFMALVCLVVASNYASRVLLLYLGKRAVLDLRLHFCGNLAVTPLSRLEQAGAHRILATLTEDIGHLTRAFGSLPVTCIHLMTIAGCTIYLAYLSPALLAFSAVYLGFAVATCLIPEARAKALLVAAREQWDVVVGRFEALIGGMKQLQLHSRRREAFLTQSLAAAARAHCDKSFRGEHIYAATRSWVEAQYFVFWAVILFNLSIFGPISAANLIAFTLTVLYLRGPIMLVLEMLPLLAQGRVSAEKIESLGLSLGDLRRSGSDLMPRATSPIVSDIVAPIHHIELVSVTHSYYHQDIECEFTLGPIDLTIEGGQLVFLVGGNGSGKTTLAKILTGLYTPQTGGIFINGRAVESSNLEWYREHFSAVFGDDYVFDSLLGVDGTDLDARARELLIELRLDHKVRVTGGTISTTRLSQGQRKRLALLTAYLEDRPFYLFDEWAADQDPLFKETFYRHLLPNLRHRGKTILAITHDDRYYGVADRIIKMESGRLVSDFINTARPVYTAVP